MMPEMFGTFFAEQRKKKGFTQARIAKELNVSTAAVSKWERGLCLPEISKFEDIAVAFKLTLMEVMQCKENEAAEMMSENVDEVISNTIELAADQHKAKEAKAKRWILTMVVVVSLALCVYFFPIYHIAQVWVPSYFTTGEISKLAYIGSAEDRAIASPFIAKANEAFSDFTTPCAELKDRHGLFARYATDGEMGGVRETHSLRLWSARFHHTDDGLGYVWVYYSHTVYDPNDEVVCGCWSVPALWIFERDSEGVWNLIYIKEHA